MITKYEQRWLDELSKRVGSEVEVKQVRSEYYCIAKDAIKPRVKGDTPMPIAAGGKSLMDALQRLKTLLEGTLE